MNKTYIIAVFAAVFLIVGSNDAAEASQNMIKKLSKQDIVRIGDIIFKNECASKDENLTAWNEGEGFMSLGIGHFIWYPADAEKSFEESFVRYLEYAKVSHARIPVWLDKKTFPSCPWNSREEFTASAQNKRLIELRDFLVRTKPLQAGFIIKRLEESLPILLKNARKERRDIVALRFGRIASTYTGVCALADYTNFKGLGIALSEKYKGQGWGLLQVLENMQNDDADPLEEFVRSANSVLETRVKNAPITRGEKRWLPGWQSRVNSYLKR